MVAISMSSIISVLVENLRFSHPSLVWSPCSGCSPGTSGMKIGPWAKDRNNLMTTQLLVLAHYQHVDGQIDRQTHHIYLPCCSIAECDKNGEFSRSNNKNCVNVCNLSCRKGCYKRTWLPRCSCYRTVSVHHDGVLCQNEYTYLQTSSPLGSHTILVFPYQTLWQCSVGDP